jgi:hypothetical protein
MARRGAAEVGPDGLGLGVALQRLRALLAAVAAHLVPLRRARWETPAVRPASSITWASARAESGVSEAGLWTIVMPAASAGATLETQREVEGRDRRHHTERLATNDDLDVRLAGLPVAGFRCPSQILVARSARAHRQAGVVGGDRRDDAPHHLAGQRVAATVPPPSAAAPCRASRALHVRLRGRSWIDRGGG